MPKQSTDFKPVRIFRSPPLTDKHGDQVVIEMQHGRMSYETEYDTDTHRLHMEVTLPVRYVTHRLDVK
jgi:hypothetical protein